ncbi:MAG: sugar transferase [Caldilineaceae bacterium]
MTYRTDDSLESGLITRKLLAKGKHIGRLARIMHGAHTYHSPLSERWTLLVLVDSLCIFAAIWLANWMTASGQAPALWLAMPPLLIGWWVLAHFNDLYDVPSSLNVQTSAVRVAFSAVLGLAACLGISFFGSILLPTRFLLIFLGCALLLILAWRFTYASQSQLLFSAHRVLLVGIEKERGDSIKRMLGTAVHLNYQILGFVDDAAEEHTTNLPQLGRLADLPDLIDELGIHEIVVATHRIPPADLINSLIKCQGQGVRVSWLADLYENFQRSVPVEEIEPTWAFNAIQGQAVFTRLQLVAKRALDLCIAISALPALLIIMPLVALAIRLDSPGAIFYRQIRAGRGNTPFTIFKFRTMRPDAEAAGKPKWAQANDPRITRVGRLLRKTRLDELPQVLNILRGDMSFVGPRPERPEFVAELEQTIPLYRTRLLVKPGLTGWAQIHYGYGNTEEDALRKLQFDFYYVRHWSLWRDIYILFQTIAVVIQCKGI